MPGGYTIVESGPNLIVKTRTVPLGNGVFMLIVAGLAAMLCERIVTHVRLAETGSASLATPDAIVAYGALAALGLLSAACAYFAILSVVNTTVLSIRGGSLSVTHEGLPYYGDIRLQTAQITKLRRKSLSSSHCVEAIGEDGAAHRISGGGLSRDDAEAFTGFVQEFLGLGDRSETRSVDAQGPRDATVAAGSGDDVEAPRTAEALFDRIRENITVNTPDSGTTGVTRIGGNHPAVGRLLHHLPDNFPRNVRYLYVIASNALLVFYLLNYGVSAFEIVVLATFEAIVFNGLPHTLLKALHRWLRERSLPGAPKQPSVMGELLASLGAMLAMLLFPTIFALVSMFGLDQQGAAPMFFFNPAFIDVAVYLGLLLLGKFLADATEVVQRGYSDPASKLDAAGCASAAHTLFHLFGIFIAAMLYFQGGTGGGQIALALFLAVRITIELIATRYAGYSFELPPASERS